MLSIGSLKLDLPVVQAALSGYSDVAMRRIARRHGAPYTINEVVLDKLVILPGKTRRRILAVEPDDHPVGGQLMGANPPDFAEAAADLTEAGYDVIDINFGCPVRKVLGRCRGGFLLSDPVTALDIVGRVVDAVGDRRPVTLKMRRGMDDGAEHERNFFTIFEGAYEAGVAAITVHGRTVKQRYIGPSDWTFLTKLRARAANCVLLGSGDLFSAEDCRRMVQETGVDGVTVARGCIGYPWIFSECRALWNGDPLPDPPTVPEQGATIREHFEECVRLYGGPQAVRRMRKFGIRYSEIHPAHTDVRAALIAASSVEAFMEVLDRWYDAETVWPPVYRPANPYDLVGPGACE